MAGQSSSGAGQAWATAMALPLQVTGASGLAWLDGKLWGAVECWVALQKGG